MSNAYRELMRRKICAEIYEGLSDDDKRTLIQAMERDRDWSEISQSLQRQEAKIDDVSRKIGRHPFATDLFSNVLGNGITDGLMWLGRALFRKL
jgi:uncharacterized protein Yka (UPF0111/DUF47 family)